MKKKVYIASSWKNQHAVAMLTALLREIGYEVISWIENNYGEDHGTEGLDFEKWMCSRAADRSFYFDVNGAMRCDVFIYLGRGGKDAGAECGMAYAAKNKGGPDKMYALHSKGEDFGLMRKMFDRWFYRHEALIDHMSKLYVEPKERKP